MSLFFIVRGWIIYGQTFGIQGSVLSEVPGSHWGSWDISLWIKGGGYYIWVLEQGWGLGLVRSRLFLLHSSLRAGPRSRFPSDTAPGCSLPLTPRGPCCSWCTPTPAPCQRPRLVRRDMTQFTSNKQTRE